MDLSSHDVLIQTIEEATQREWSHMILNRRFDTGVIWITWILRILLLMLSLSSAIIFGAKNIPVPIIIHIFLVLLTSINLLIPILVNEKRFKQRMVLHDRRWRYCSDLLLNVKMKTIPDSEAAKLFSRYHSISPEDEL